LGSSRDTDTVGELKNRSIKRVGRRSGQGADESRLPLEQQLTNFARISIG